MTEASVGPGALRDFSTLKWYVIPLLAIVLYIYAVEMRKARASRNWDAVFAGLTLFGMDFFNETWNGWVLAITGHSAFWTTPGRHGAADHGGLEHRDHVHVRDRRDRLLLPCALKTGPSASSGSPPGGSGPSSSRRSACSWNACSTSAATSSGSTAFWNRTFAGIWLILVFGYFEFFAAVNLVLARKTNRAKVTAVGIIYAVPVLMNIIGMGSWLEVREKAPHARGFSGDRF